MTSDGLLRVPNTSLGLSFRCSRTHQVVRLTAKLYNRMPFRACSLSRLDFCRASLQWSFVTRAHRPLGGIETSAHEQEKSEDRSFGTQFVSPSKLSQCKIHISLTSQSQSSIHLSPTSPHHTPTPPQLEPNRRFHHVNFRRQATLQPSVHSKRDRCDWT